MSNKEHSAYCNQINCPYIKEKGYVYVGHSGKKGSEIMIIGERGGPDECRMGTPFIGRSGELLSSLLHRVGVRRQECFITNAVGCGKRSTNTPKVGELQACKGYVDAQIKHVQPKLIILMGGTAMYPIYNTTTGVKRNHGRIEWSDEYNCFVIVTYHPSAALRDKKGHLEWAILKDLQRGIGLLKGEWEIEFPVIKEYDTVEDIVNFLTSLKEHDKIAWDTETNTLDIHSCPEPKIACLSFATDGDTGHVVWIRELPEKDVISHIAPALKEVLESTKKLSIGANLKYDNTMVERVLGIHPKPPQFDTIIAHRMVYTATREHGLKTMALQFTHMPYYEKELDEYRGRDDGYYSVPRNILAPYSGYDAVTTWRAYEAMDEHIKKRRCFSLNPVERKTKAVSLEGAFQLNMDVLNMLEEVEKRGVSLDVGILISLKSRYEEKRNALLKEFYSFDEVRRMELNFHIQKLDKEVDRRKKKAARLKDPKKISKNAMEIDDYLTHKEELMGLYNDKESFDTYFETEGQIREINIDSTVQMGKLLSQHCGVESKKKTATGAISVNVDALNEIDHPIARLILEHRHIHKMLSTYIEPMLTKRDPDTGVIHPSYVVNGAVSGRLTSSFHTIPAHGEVSILRAPLVSSYLNGNIVGADFSQMELKTAASIANDTRMMKAMRDGEDIHRLTASKIFGIPPEEITDEQRQVGKTLNFGLIYSISPWGMVNQGIVDNEEVGQDFQDSFFELYPGIKKWMDVTGGKVANLGVGSSPLGRWRDLRIEKQRYHSSAVRKGINYPIQSTASDYALLATVKMHQWLKESGKTSRMIGMVHDSAYIDTPPEETLEVIMKFKGIAESGDFGPYFNFSLSVPLEVDFKCGASLHMDKNDELPSGFFDNPTQEFLDAHIEGHLKRREELFKKEPTDEKSF